MEVELWKIDDVKPYPNNPRLNDDAVDAVATPNKPEEAWAPVPGYEGLYDVSSFGRVRRSSNSRMAPAGYVRKPRISWDGYLQYGLSKRCRYWHVKAHRLVALAFLGPPPRQGLHVAHYDGNKLNNHVSNLRWASPAENEADKRRHGRTRGAPSGEKHPMAKLTVETVMLLRRLAAAGRTVKSIAQGFGIATLTAYDAIVGKTWKLVTEPGPVALKRRRLS